MATPAHISVDDLFAPPTRTQATISPDGTRIAYLAPWKDRLNVWVEDVDGGREARCVTADETRSVIDYQWTDDPRWLLYLQDNGGDENWHVYRVDLDDPSARCRRPHAVPRGAKPTSSCWPTGRARRWSA